MNSSATRREWLQSGGLMLAGLCLPRLAVGADQPVAEIRLHSTRDGGRVWFDPVGLWVRSGTMIRWINELNVHTVAAYHPRNNDHALRIPRGAEPWDSGYLTRPGDRFEITLTEIGVYDYYCAPHEAAGMAGRIIVQEPAGPGTLAYDYFRDDESKSHWKPVPDRVQAALPPVETIMAQRVVHARRGGRPVADRMNR